MIDVKSEVIEHALNNPKAQTVVASSTTALAIDYNIMHIIPSIITVIGGSLGIVLTIMMIVHKYVQIRNDLKA